MRFFESIEQYLLIIGINPNQAYQKNRLNGRNLTILLVLGIGIGFNLLYTIYEAESFQEFNISLFITSTLLITSICFTNLISNMPKIFQFFNSIEDTVNKSMLKLNFCRFL